MKDGKTKSPTQTTAQATCLDGVAGPPVLAVSALLQLVQWHHSYRLRTHGDITCLPHDIAPPPPKTEPLSADPAPGLATPPADPTAPTAPAPGPTPHATPAASSCTEGGRP